MRSGHPRGTQSRRTLSVPQAAGDLGDERPLTIFAAALTGPSTAPRDVRRAFFGVGTRAAPAAVAADRLSGSTARADGAHAVRLPRAADARAGPVGHAALRLRHGAPAAHRPAGARSTAQARESVRDQRSALGRLAPAGRLRRRPAWVARELHGTPTSCAARRSTRRSAGTTRSRRAATTSTARAPTSARAAGCTTCCRWSTPSPRSRARSCAITSGSSRRRTGLPYGLAAVHALRTSARRTTSTSGCCSPPPSTASARATWRFFDERHAVLRHGREGVRVGAHEARVPAPGVAARPERRLPRGDQRRLVGLLHAAPADDRVDARRRPSSPTPTRGSPSWPSCAATRFAATLRARGARAAGGAATRVDRARAGTRAATSATDQIGTGVIYGEPQPWAILAGAPTPGAGAARSWRTSAAS